MTTLAIDVAIIAIIVFCGWRGYRNGLIRGVFGVVTLIVALIIGSIVAAAYAEEVTGVLKPFVGGIVDSAIADMLEEDAKFEPLDHDNDTEDFRTAYNALRQIGLPKSAAISIAEQAADNDSQGFLSEFVSDKLSLALAYVALFGIAFLLIAIIFAVIGNLISFVFSLPGLKLIDTVAGVAFGIIKGVLIVLAITTVVRYYGVLASSTLEETTVLNYFVNHNMISNMLGI